MVQDIEILFALMSIATSWKVVRPDGPSVEVQRSKSRGGHRLLAAIGWLLFVKEETRIQLTC